MANPASFVQKHWFPTSTAATEKGDPGRVDVKHAVAQVSSVMFFAEETNVGNVRRNESVKQPRG